MHHTDVGNLLINGLEYFSENSDCIVSMFYDIVRACMKQELAWMQKIHAQHHFVTVFWLMLVKRPFTFLEWYSTKPYFQAVSLSTL